jgi:TolB-like protein
VGIVYIVVGWLVIQLGEVTFEALILPSWAPSIAVFPFDDMSEHGDQGYFCEGIAEEILNSLCKVANLLITAQKQVDPKAYDFFLRGQSYFAKHNIQDTVYARQMFKRALEVDPD